MGVYFMQSASPVDPPPPPPPSLSPTLPTSRTEAEPHPDPVQETDVNVMQLLAMGNTCPYMPTSFRQFLKVAVQLGRAVKPTSTVHSTNTSTVTDDLAAAAAMASGLSTNEDDGEGLSARTIAPPEAVAPPFPAGVSRGRESGDETGAPPPEQQEHGVGNEDGGVGEVEEVEEEGDEDEEEASAMPSFAPRDRRGVARMASAPIMAASGGRRKSSVSSMGSGMSWEGGSARNSVNGPVKDDAPTDGENTANARPSFMMAMSSVCMYYTL